MNLILASDHRGKGIRNLILDYLSALEEYRVVSLNDLFPENTDYPDIAAYAAKEIVSGKIDRAILICGTGIGMSIVANKFPGIRAAPCHNAVVAELSRKHNDANVLCLSGDLLGERSSIAVVTAWLTTPFEGGRHRFRIDKIKQLELKNYRVL